MSETGQKPHRRKIRGVVVSDKMDKTIVVQSTRLVKHPMYGKYYKRSKKYKVHDEKREAHVGDTVDILESRPISKQKRFRLSEIIEKAKRVESAA